MSLWILFILRPVYDCFLPKELSNFRFLHWVHTYCFISEIKKIASAFSYEILVHQKEFLKIYNRMNFINVEKYPGVLKYMKCGIYSYSL